MTTKTQDSSDKKKLISGEVPEATMGLTMEVSVSTETVAPVSDPKTESSEAKIRDAAGCDVTASSPTLEALPSGNSKETLAAAIVRKYVYWSMGAGVVPLPLVDVAGVAAAQVFLVRELSTLYGVTFSEHRTEKVVALLIGSLGNRVLAQVAVGTLFKTLPFGGALIGSLLALPTMAGACTYALGKVFVRHFESGGTLLDLNTAQVKGYFEKQFKKGKESLAKTTPVAVELPVVEGIRA